MPCDPLNRASRAALRPLAQDIHGAFVPARCRPERGCRRCASCRASWRDAADINSAYASDSRALVEAQSGAHLVRYSPSGRAHSWPARELRRAASER